MADPSALGEPSDLDDTAALEIEPTITAFTADDMFDSTRHLGSGSLPSASIRPPARRRTDRAAIALSRSACDDPRLRRAVRRRHSRFSAQRETAAAGTTATITTETRTAITTPTPITPALPPCP